MTTTASEQQPTPPNATPGSDQNMITWEFLGTTKVSTRPNSVTEVSTRFSALYSTEIAAAKEGDAQRKLFLTAWCGGSAHRVHKGRRHSDINASAITKIVGKLSAPTKGNTSNAGEATSAAAAPLAALETAHVASRLTVQGVFEKLLSVPTIASFDKSVLLFWAGEITFKGCPFPTQDSREIPPSVSRVLGLLSATTGVLGSPPHRKTQKMSISDEIFPEVVHLVSDYFKRTAEQPAPYQQQPNNQLQSHAPQQITAAAHEPSPLPSDEGTMQPDDLCKQNVSVYHPPFCLV